MNNHRVDAIDAVRGFVALYVLAFHIIATTPAHYPLVVTIFSLPGIAVSVFFCFSGFLVYGSLSRRVMTEASWKANFLIRRFFRIIPLWWAILLFEFCSGSFTTKVLFANMFFYFGVVSFLPAYLPIVTAWSLFVEELFYLILPSIFKSVQRGTVWRYFAVTYVICLIWQRYAISWGVSDANWYIWRSPFANFQYFFLGIITYQIYNSVPVMEVVKKMSGGAIVTWLDGFAVAGIVSASIGLGIPNELIVFSFVMSVIVPGTLIHRLINVPFFRWAGVRCYCIYIVQFVVIVRLMGVVEYLEKFLNVQNSFGEIKFLIEFPLAVTATCAVAAFTFEFLEKPCWRLAESLIAYRANGKEALFPEAKKVA